jgi:hypothetical protein
VSPVNIVDLGRRVDLQLPRMPRSRCDLAWSTTSYWCGASLLSWTESVRRIGTLDRSPSQAVGTDYSVSRCGLRGQGRETTGAGWSAVGSFAIAWCPPAFEALGAFSQKSSPRLFDLTLRGRSLDGPPTSASDCRPVEISPTWRCGPLFSRTSKSATGATKVALRALAVARSELAMRPVRRQVRPHPRPRTGESSSHKWSCGVTGTETACRLENERKPGRLSTVRGTSCRNGFLPAKHVFP